MKHIKNFKLFERNWKLTIDVKSTWDELSELIGESDEILNPEEYKRILDIIVRQLKKYSTVIEKMFGEDEANEFENIVDDLSMQDDLEGFNYTWNDLYDFCDNNSIWLKTMI